VGVYVVMLLKRSIVQDILGALWGVTVSGSMP
jgi:hypothetical protein